MFAALSGVLILQKVRILYVCVYVCTYVCRYARIMFV